MTTTLISLLSIIIGILGGNTMELFKLKKYYGLVGNTIAGVFGSIFCIKTFGRLGFNPHYIIQNGIVDYSLLVLNLIVSFAGGMGFVNIIYYINQKLNRK